MTANITPEGLRERALLAEGGEYDGEDPAQLRAHAAALEELARLKAPVEVAGIIESLNAEINDYEHPQAPPGTVDVLRDCRAALESLAAQVAEAQSVKLDLILDREKVCKDRDDARKQLAERDAEIAALKGHAEAMWKLINGNIGESKIAHETADTYRAAYPKADKGE